MKVILALIFICIVSLAAMGQDVTPTPETVTISKAAAVKCLENSDKLASIELENKAQVTAIADLKALISDLKITIAGLSGEKTQLESTLVRYNAIIDFLLKNGRIKKYGIINF